MSDNKQWLDIPFEKKEEAKKAGAMFDEYNKVWFYFAPTNELNQSNNPWVVSTKNAEFLQQWAITPEQKDELSAERFKQWLHVPYEEKDLAKEAGAKFDGKENMWFADKNSDMTVLTKYAISEEQKNEIQKERSDRQFYLDNKQWLNVPFEEKDLAKEAGAKFDNKEKMWFALPSHHDSTQKWAISDEQKNEIQSKRALAEDSKQWLNVPFKDKDLAKEAGAVWDNKDKMWFAGNDAKMEVLDKYAISKEEKIDLQAQRGQPKSIIDKNQSVSNNHQVSMQSFVANKQESKIETNTQGNDVGKSRSL